MDDLKKLFVNSKEYGQDKWGRVSQLVGHVTYVQTTRRYKKRFNPKMLFEKTIKNLNYDIDFSHLKNSKWVPR